MADFIERPIKTVDEVGGFFRTGIVTGASTWSETNIRVTTSGGGGHLQNGSGYVSPTTTTTSSTATEVNRFFLKYGDDSEEEIKLRGGEFSVRDGHSVSLVRVGPKGENWGYNVAFYNHVTRTEYSPEANLEHPLEKRPAKIFLWLGPLGGLALGVALGGGFIGGLLLGAVAFGFAFRAYSKAKGERRVLIEAVRTSRTQQLEAAKAKYAAAAQAAILPEGAAE